MTAFLELQHDIFAKHAAELSQRLPDGVFFRAGTVIRQTLPTPLRFGTTHSKQAPPGGMLSNRVPVMSHLLVKALEEAGVSNLQLFAAEVTSRVDGTIWNDYYAVNVVGLVSCADLAKSEYTTIMDRPGEGALPLMAFQDLKIDATRAEGWLLFRLAEDPGTIVVADRVVEHLRAQRSDEDWGITLDER
jgi:hypothetical protein